MKSFNFFTVLLIVFCLSCKKSAVPTPSPVVPGGGNGNQPSCDYLAFFQFAGNPNPWFFEYNSKGKLAKARWFPNGPYQPLTKLFVYDNTDRLININDSSANGGSNTEFMNHNAAGYPALAMEKSNNKKIVQLEFVYGPTGNIIKKIFQWYDDKEVALPVKDTMLFYYDAASNIIKETVITRLNSIRREYILLEAEGYDQKSSFYKSLGNEFAYLYRWNRAGEGFLNQGFYLFSPNANNPGRVYLHNQNLTDDNNKGDYITYTYQYDNKGLPIKFTHTYNNGNGNGNNPGGKDSISYSCH